MGKTGKYATRIAVALATIAATAIPAAPALADDNPCKGDGTTQKCRPACFFYVDVHPGDPANGEAPWVEVGKTFC